MAYKHNDNVFCTEKNEILQLYEKSEDHLNVSNIHILDNNASGIGLKMPNLML